MTLVTFQRADGSSRSRTGVAGERLLDVAQADGQPLEGTCNGDMACGTCHVIVAAADFGMLPPAGTDEEDMLDMIAGSVRTSRLSCQITLAANWECLTVTVPD